MILFIDNNIYSFKTRVSKSFLMGFQVFEENYLNLIKSELYLKVN
jgi:hypothetical protein